MSDKNYGRQYLDFVCQHKKDIFNYIPFGAQSISFRGKIPKKPVRNGTIILNGIKILIHSVSFDAINKNSKFNAVFCPCNNEYKIHYPYPYLHSESTPIHHAHILFCPSIAKKVRLIDEDMIGILAKYQLSRKRPSREIRRLFPDYFDATDNLIDNNEEVQCNPAPLSQFCLSFLRSSRKVKSFNQFPSSEGVYLIRYLNNEEWIPLYVGRSKDLYQRWKQHHRKPEIELLQTMGIKLEFSYLVEDPMTKLNITIEELEERLIKEFNPKLNRTPALKIAHPH